MNIHTAETIIQELNQLKGTDEKRRVLSSFFKTGEGQYAEGDIMLGVTVPDNRRVAKKYADSSLNLVGELLANEVHEVRLCALLILVAKYQQARRVKPAEQAGQMCHEIVSFYLAHAPRINNWDLVDLSAPYILGEWLKDKADRSVLYTLAKDPLVWRRRIAVVSTLTLVRDNQLDDTIRLAHLLKCDPHDLMRKAVGWALREVGKKNEAMLLKFLDETYRFLPRTTLRYAIERLSPNLRQHYMQK